MLELASLCAFIGAGELPCHLVIRKLHSELRPALQRHRASVAESKSGRLWKPHIGAALEVLDDLFSVSTIMHDGHLVLCFERLDVLEGLRDAGLNGGVEFKVDMLGWCEIVSSLRWAKVDLSRSE